MATFLIMLAAIGVAFAFVDVWYFLRTIGTVLKIKLRRRVLLSRWKSCQEEDILKEYRIHGVVLLSDIDFQLHMNNSKYLREMDFGRVAMFQERGIYDTLVALKAKRLVVAALSIRYRRSLRLFDRFTLKTRIIYWEAEAMYIEQSFVASDGFITTVTLGKLVAKGTTINALLKAVVGKDVAPPQPPSELLKWMESNIISSDKLKEKAKQIQAQHHTGSVRL